MRGLAKGVHQTGATFRVQRTKGTHAVRASFKTRDQANAYSLAVEAAWAAGASAPSVHEFLLGYASSSEERAAATRQVPTRLDDLVETAICANRDNKHLDDGGVPKKQRGQWRSHGAFFNNVDVRNLTRQRVQEYALHLYGKRLSRSTANEHIRLVRMACDMAMELKLVPTNVAKGVVGHHQDNPLTPHDRVQPRPLTPTEVKALAAQFPDWLQVAVFLMYVGCLRISEVFGLELRDWDSSEQTLRVRRQGGLGKNEGRRDPYRTGEADGRLKNKSSRRTIPLPAQLAEVIDRHIEFVHGSRPADGPSEEQWLRRRLISTSIMNKPRQGVITQRWDAALHDVGLDFDTIGFKICRHFLRKAGSTVIGIGDIRGKLWSGYLGHQTPAEFGGSLTTVRHYFDLPDTELVAVANRWEEVIREDAGDLIITPEWSTTPHMTLQEAAVSLGVHETSVRALVNRGRVLLAPQDEVQDVRHRAGTRSFTERVMVSGPSVHAELERRQRLATRLTESDVMKQLGITRYHVQSLRDRGVLEAEQEQSRVWSFVREPVDALEVELGRERDDAHLFIGAAEAGAALGLTGYQFERVAGDRVAARTLIITQQKQYLRADVEILAQQQPRPRSARQVANTTRRPSAGAA